ncbi:MAG TPA: HAMP domain-containing sensor histidine kinase [Acidimicrobiia bacterium]|jgi:signal transduction histidine kinase
MQLPPVTRSLRFRLSGLTSALVFSVAGLALAGIYFVTLRAVQSITVTERALEPVLVDGERVVIRLTQVEMRTIESFFKEAVLNQLAIWTIAIMLALFALSLIVGWVVASRSLRPIDEITSVAREIEATDLDRRIGLDGPDDELTRMADTFDAMLDRLSGSFRSQQRFLAHTSHDLRTPLAVIRSNLEIIANDPDATVQDWRQTGEIVERAADRISVMVDDLLALARQELAGSTLTPIDPGEVVAELVADLASTARAGGVSIVADIPAEPLTVAADSNLLRRAIGNLVDNAARESPEGATVRVAVRRDGKWTYLGVLDEGPGIDVELALNGDRGNGGMGLGIVRQIVAMHAGRFSASIRPEGGSILSIALPEEPDPSTPPMSDARLPELYR